MFSDLVKQGIVPGQRAGDSLHDMPVVRCISGISCSAHPTDCTQRIRRAVLRITEKGGHPVYQVAAFTISGGDEGARTPDPHVANVVLSQLSYIPTDWCA